MSDNIASETDLIAALAAQHAKGELYSPPSESLGQFDLKRAYDLQRAYVKDWQTRDAVGGFKAAVTAPPMQKAFGLPGPVTSVLFSKGSRENNCVIGAKEFRTLLVETELSFRLSESVNKPLQSINEVKELIARCSPTFELADPGFGAQKFTGEDLVATNIACGGWIEGESVDWQTANLDEINVRLTHEGNELHNAAAGSVMDGQWQALFWLINQTVAQGYTITPDHVLLSGAIGAAHPGQAGHYVADYGEAGQIEFEVSA